MSSVNELIPHEKVYNNMLVYYNANPYYVKAAGLTGASRKAKSYVTLRGLGNGSRLVNVPKSQLRYTEAERWARLPKPLDHQEKTYPESTVMRSYSPQELEAKFVPEWER